MPKSPQETSLGDPYLSTEEELRGKSCAVCGLEVAPEQYLRYHARLDSWFHAEHIDHVNESVVIRGENVYYHCMLFYIPRTDKYRSRYYA